LAKAQLGTKRTCPSCAARFYDLAKSPAECPKCEHSFDPEVLLKPRRPRPEPVRVVKKEEPETEEAEADEEEEEVVEVEADVVAPVEAALDTEEEDTPPETGAPPRKGKTPLEEDGLVVVEEEGEEDEEVEIAEIEEEDGDVSGILDADIDKEEP
jgi:uncharacterized protein (TIGR02300 family)